MRKVAEWPEVATSSRYPWDEILDGSVWELRRGEDFNAKPTTMIANARSQAKRRGGTVRTRAFVRDGDDFVLLQYRPARGLA